MEQTAVLELNNLSKHFGGVKAVDQVTMKLYPKEILAIVGDNVSCGYRRCRVRVKFSGLIGSRSFILLDA